MKTTTQKTGNETTLKVVTALVSIAFFVFAYFIVFVHPGNIN